MIQKYSIGLDLGTNSIGWSVINRDFTLVKKGGKNLWGVLLFDEAEKADKRRVKRSARRRSERRKERIKLLQQLLANDVNLVDSDFYTRLKKTYLANESIDKVSGRNYHYNLFNDTLNDKKYYHEFPTIYHLRKRLCEDDSKFDIRLVYLAIHHIIKYRGNFLHDENKIVPSSKGVIEKLQEVFDCNNDLFDKYGVSSLFDATKLYEILKLTNKTPSDKAKEVKLLLGGSAFAEFIGKALCGLVASPKKAFKTDEEEYNDAKDVVFSKDTFESIMQENESVLGEDITIFIFDLHSVYIEKTFVEILGEGNDSVSMAMVKRYEDHHADLRALKSVLLPKNSINFKKMFDAKYVDENGKIFKNSYANYVHVKRGKSRFNDATCEKEDFYKFCKDLLVSVENDGEKGALKAKILQKIELGTFMPKINDVVNGAIPYQINLNELEKIIDNQSKYYETLKQNKDKIISLLTFRRPYYVGPLKGEFSWINQTINEKVYPWNFENLVDVDEARNNFIEKLVEKDEFTNTPKLPLQSITYQKYVVLNELNNLKINDKPLPVEVKQGIYNNLILKKSKVTNKEVYYYVNNNWVACSLEDFNFANDKNLLGNMKTYREFSKILGEDFVNSNPVVCDKIVEYLTVFTDYTSKKRMLKKKFSNILSKESIEKLAKLSYSGWGKFSYEHLTDKYDESETAKSILTLLYETNQNYISIIFNDAYGFKERFTNEIKKVEKVSYRALISDLYSSPAVKKVTWQAVKLINEIVKIMGGEPEFVFIESARKEEEKKRSKTRYNELSELYESVKNDTEYYNNELKKQLTANNDEKLLQNERLYLYLRQLGRCMYTEKPLDINRLDEYEVDHIVPRCFIKDDSLENKVLVIREANQRKSSLTISENVIKARIKFWSFLRDNKFITQKKYSNLIKDDWNEKDGVSFINRQLTETNQINKTVETTLKSVLKTTEVMPIKSAIVTQVRKLHTDKDSQTFGSFYKVRGLNDYHHAKDAYLVAVMGIFTKINFPVWGNEEKAYAIKKVLEKAKLSEKKTNELINKRYGIIVDYLIHGDYECANANGEPIDGNTAYNNVLKTMDRNDISVVVQKNFDGETMFYKETIYGKPEYSKKDNLIPYKYVKDVNGNLLPLDTKIYGGYSSVQQSYYVNVEHGKPNKRKTELVGVSALDALRYKNGDKNAILNALSDKENPIIIGKPVYKNQLINYKGQYVTISSASEVTNATQLIIDKKYHKLLSYAEKGIINFKKYNEEYFNKDCEQFFKEYFSKMQKYYPLYKNVMQKLQKYINEKFESSSIEDKLKFIRCMLSITKDGATNMSSLKLGSAIGRLNDKTIVKNEVDWINQSITGYYVNIIPKKVN